MSRRSSFLGRFDRWVRERAPGVDTTTHQLLWDCWVAALGNPPISWPGTETASLGAECKRCGDPVNRADAACRHCGYVFPSDPDYPSKEDS